MPFSIRALSVVALAGALFAILFTKGSAEPPVPMELRVFRDAAEGNFKPGGTGNLILDDIVDIMKERHSVLDEFPDDLLLDDADGGVLSGDTRDMVSRRAIAAEQMLRAARLLEKLGENEPNRLALIKQMRSEAKQLLTE